MLDPTPFYLHGTRAITTTKGEPSADDIVASVYGKGDILKQRADFIVRACNNHWNLVLWCGWLAELVESTSDDFGADRKTIDVCLRKIKEGIAEAKGQSC